VNEIPLGVTLCNLGDLRPLANGQLWDGQTGVVDGFCQFSDIRWGLRALGKTLASYSIVGWSTPVLMASHYAPAGDGTNDPNRYAADFANQLGIGINDHIPLATSEQMADAIHAITVNEVGSGWCPSSWFDEAAAVALGAPIPASWAAPAAADVPAIPASPQAAPDPSDALNDDAALTGV
jgi:hypothetical protein